MIATNTFKIYFDGGYQGRGRMYGSWEIEHNGFSKKVSRVPLRLDFPGRDSCNTAEYLSLLAALEWLRSVKHPKRYRLEIQSDSELLVKQVAGECRCHKQHLKELCGRVRGHLVRFDDAQISWRRRHHNVARFGH